MFNCTELRLAIEALKYDAEEGMDRLHALLRRLEEEEEADFAAWGEEQERQARAA